MPLEIRWDSVTDCQKRYSPVHFSVLQFFSPTPSSSVNSSFGILHYFVQGGQRKEKRMRVTSPNREAFVDQTLPPLQMGGPSQPQQWPQLGQDLSTDSSDDERNLVSFADIMNAAEDAMTQIKGGRISLNR